MVHNPLGQPQTIHRGEPLATATTARMEGAEHPQRPHHIANTQPSPEVEEAEGLEAIGKAHINENLGKEGTRKCRRLL